MSDEERATVAHWSRRLKSAHSLALRSRIVLARGWLVQCGGGTSLVVSRPTVGKWRSRFIERRLGGLVDEDRPGARRKITDEQVEQVVMATPESTVESTVGRIWTAF